MGDQFDDQSLTTPPPGAVEASAAEGATGPAVGRDEWVARHGERRFRRGGRIGVMEERLRSAPWWAWLTLFLAVLAVVPVFSDSGYVRRVAFDTLLYMLLALGLNVVLGWGGLLDLGYVAFYGIGAYTYAVLNSEKYDIHLGAVPSMVVVLLVGMVAGFLVGLPSRRLSGDYLAIVTLFFLQIFLTFTINSDNIKGENLLGGPNGILNIDGLTFFGHEVPVAHDGIFNVAYLYIGLAVFAVVYVALHFVNHSRTGRAWRSLREDPLAAELMGMPVNWLKLMSFAFGAAVAALTGVLLTSLDQSVFPLTFSFPLLITVYTMVILGGSGNQAGVVVGAILISVTLEFLREPDDARLLFYGVILFGIVAAFRWSWRLGLVLGGTFVFGQVVHTIAKQIDESWVSGGTTGTGWLADAASNWVIVPSDVAGWIAPVSYIGLIALTLLLTLLRGWVRYAVLIPTLYLAAFVWENVMLAKPEPTRFIVLGALLIALMIARPNGILGERRVEIV